MNEHNCFDYKRVPDKLGNPITGETLVYRCAGCKAIIEYPHLFMTQMSKFMTQMSKKDSAITEAMALLAKAGYTISYEALPIGKAGAGIHLHVVDEIDRKSDGMADTDLTKPIRLTALEWEQLNKALEGEK